MREFFSQHSIDDSVDFYPMFKQAKKQGIAQELLQGTIVSVRFTKVKVFYDVISDYYGAVTMRVPNKFCEYIVAFEYNDVDIIAHEITHLKNYIFEDRGLILDVKNDEAEASCMYAVKSLFV